MIIRLLIGGNSEMNYVIAKAKKESEYKKLYSGESIFVLPDNLEGSVEYNPATILEDGEWFVINDFSSKEYSLNLFEQEFRSTDYSIVSKDEIHLIEYICSYENDTYFFQRILKNSIFAKKHFSLGDNVSLQTEKGLMINEWPDAIFIKENNKLYFKKLQTIIPIFKGIEELYKEATSEEIETFLQNDFINTVNDYCVDKVKTMNRKRIALAMESLKQFNKKQRKEVLDYTHRYYPQLEYKNNAFSIGNEEDLKYVLWGIEQRYYTTPVTKEKRVANSILSLD